MHREVVQRREIRPPLDDVEHLLVHGPKGVLTARETEVQEAPQQEHIQALVVLPVCVHRQQLNAAAESSSGQLQYPLTHFGKGDAETDIGR